MRNRSRHSGSRSLVNRIKRRFGEAVCVIPYRNAVRRVPYRNAVPFHSPESRSALRASVRNDRVNPNGVPHGRGGYLWNPDGIHDRLSFVDPGCAARPWAVECNAVGVRTIDDRT